MKQASPVPGLGPAPRALVSIQLSNGMIALVPGKAECMRNLIESIFFGGGMDFRAEAEYGISAHSVLKPSSPARFSSTFDSRAVVTRAEGKPIQDAEHRTPQTTITASLACLPSCLPSTQPSPPAPAGALAPSCSPPSAICWATHWPCCVREWALGHGSTQARVPGYQESMCEPCVCREAAAQLGRAGGEDGHVA